MNRQQWTREELDILVAHWPQGGVQECAALLPARSMESLRGKAYYLGLRLDGRKPRSPVTWTPSMDQILRDAYTRPEPGVVKDAARRLGVSYAAIRSRARNLGVVRRYAYNRLWVPEEDDIIREYAERLSYIYTRLKKAGFPRSLSAIVSRRSRLGCAGQVDPGRFTATALAQLCGVQNKTVLSWIAKGWLRADRRSPQCALWNIKLQDFRDFIRDHPTVIDLRKVDGPWFLDVVLGQPRFT
jgi:hypothetical protein